MNTKELIAKARDIMESFDESAAMTIGYDKPSYTLTAEQMLIIAAALYHADCEIQEDDGLPFYADILTNLD
jgi:hypothetical protein